MPLRYASETAEHNAVRTAAGLFDLSHMGEIAVTGPGAGAALDYALTGHLSAVAPGRARYTMICAPDGGVLDDLVVYRLGDDEYRGVANPANAAGGYGGLRRRRAAHDAGGVRWNGTGLGAERRRAEAGLGGVVGSAKPGDFGGREALENRAEPGPVSKLMGLVSRTRRVPRHGYPVLRGGEMIGTVTSGAPSPTLGRPIAMAYVRPDAVDAVDAKDAAGPAQAANGPGSPRGSAARQEAGTAGRLAVDVRGHAEPADYVQLPFYRRAK